MFRQDLQNRSISMAQNTAQYFKATISLTKWMKSYFVDRHNSTVLDYSLTEGGAG